MTTDNRSLRTTENDSFTIQKTIFDNKLWWWAEWEKHVGTKFQVQDPPVENNCFKIIRDGKEIVSQQKQKLVFGIRKLGFMTTTVCCFLVYGFEAKNKVIKEDVCKSRRRRRVVEHIFKFVCAVAYTGKNVPETSGQTLCYV